MDNFTTEEPVINHPSINKDELVSLQSNIVNDFYTDPKYIEHVKNKIKAHSYLRNSFLEYFEFLINKGILNANYIASNFN
jgi:protoheme ferro-lyase